jgi:hypothetical protein
MAVFMAPMALFTDWHFVEKFKTVSLLKTLLL